MNIADIAVEEFLSVETDTRMGKVRSMFEDGNPKGLVVLEDGAFAGVITERQVLQSHVEDDAKVAALIKPSRTDPVPRIDRHEDVREAARMLIEGNTSVAPVVENGDLWGIITHDAILEAVLENLGALTVGDVYSEDPVTVREDDGVGKAINRLREHGISRLPVRDESGLTGVVTTHDIAEFVIREDERTTTGDRVGDNDRMLDVPVYDIMNTPVETVGVEAPLDVAVERMLEFDYGGLVVTPDGDDREILGLVTKTDILRALTYTERQRMDVQITNVALLDTLTRESIVESVEAVADKFAEMQVVHAHVRFHEHKERHRGIPLLSCRIRLRTNKGQVAGSGEGYGADSAFRVAMDTLERNVLELKGITSDAEYRGQLLRKLNEL